MDAHVVLGSFFGDEGKGQTVHNLCKAKNADLVVRFSGGHQVGHTVHHEGKSHIFTNFGSGTLLGVSTYWSQFCTVDPLGSLVELEELNKMGVVPSIIYHPLCQVVTPYDIWHQWADEDNRTHGSVGVGYFPCLQRVKAGYSLTVSDCLDRHVLKAKLESIRDNYYHTKEASTVVPLDEWIAKTSAYFSINRTEREQFILAYNTVVFEGSQGILLDQRFGIMPYCTPSNTTSQNIGELFKEPPCFISYYYVARPYITRHGNGPIPANTLPISVVDKTNGENEFQGSLRAVEMDFQLLHHSLRTGGYMEMQGDIDSHRKLVITHKDELSNELLSKFEKFAEYEGIDLIISEYDNIYVGC